MRTLYPNYFNSQNNYFIIQKIINKIKNALIQNKKRWKESLTEEVLRKLQNEHDGKGVDIDLAFGGIEIVNKIADILKIENQELLQEAIFFTADYNIQQFLKDKENLNNLKLREIHNPGCLFNAMDDFLKYLSEKGYSTIKELRDGIEQKENYKKENYNSEVYEKLRKKESAIKDLRTKLESKTVLDYEKAIQLIEEISKMGLFNNEIAIKNIVFYPDERMKRLEQLVNSTNKEKFQMEKLELEGEINKEKKELEKVSKILDLKKQYIEPINEKRREQYRDLRALLLKLNSPSLQYLERYYKFKKYEKYLSDPILLYRCTRQDWMNIYYADC